MKPWNRELGEVTRQVTAGHRTARLHLLRSERDGTERQGALLLLVTTFSAPATYLLCHESLIFAPNAPTQTVVNPW